MDNEYIRRDVALRAVAKRYGACRSPAQNRLLDEIRNEIRRAPAADVAPVVHGRWIYHDDGVITCSECGNAESSDSYYCRYCGAKMDKEDAT